MSNNFVAKVWDASAGAYTPIYTAPDATDKIKGDVYLSDSINSDLGVDSGIAATPKAVKTVADRKLDMISSSEQVVTSPVTFRSNVTAEKYFVGNLKGIATEAVTLKNAQTFSLEDKGGNTICPSVDFDGSADVKFVIDKLPISVLPDETLGHLEKVKNQSARYQLTADKVQNGDSVLEEDTGIMYLVVDSSQLTSESGYQAYQASTAAKLNVSDAGGSTEPVYFKDGVPVACTSYADASVASAVRAKLADAALAATKLVKTVTDNGGTDEAYAIGSSTTPVYFSKGVPVACTSYANATVKSATTATTATTASKLNNTLALGGDVTAVSTSLNTTAAITLSTTIGEGKVTTTKLANASNSTTATGVTTAKIENGAVTTAKLASKAVTTEKLADASNSTTATGVTTAKIENGAVTLGKIDVSVGTVASGSSAPVSLLDGHYKLYGQTTDGALSAVYIRI